MLYANQKQNSGQIIIYIAELLTYISGLPYLNVHENNLQILILHVS